jgi:hypothetical protein
MDPLARIGYNGLTGESDAAALPLSKEKGRTTQKGIL